MSKHSLSVIICTHDPRPDYFLRALEALKVQSVPLADWELLIVDNASPETIADRFDVSWHPNGRHVEETELGLTAARLRGISEARSELLVFVDDDNILAPDYLEQARKIQADYPFLGAWGGSIFPEFERKPPQWTKKYWGRLALHEIHDIRWSNDPHNSRKPCGAGLCIKSSVARLYREELGVDKIRRQLGRKGKSLFSTEDTDMVNTCTRLELGWGLFPQLELTHIIPDARLTEDYLLRLSEDMTASGTIFDLKNGKDVKNRQGWRQQMRYLNVLLKHGPREARFYLATERGKQRGISIARHGQIWRR